MTNPFRKDAGLPAGVPIIDPNKEPAWIRDISAAQFGVTIRSEDDAAALCGEDSIWCEYCGAMFPLWPIREYASHQVHDHHDTLTDQQIGAIAQLLAPGLTEQIKLWLGLQFMQRVELRRRARDLDLIVWPDRQPGGSN
jgi:hypothetical protein